MKGRERNREEGREGGRADRDRVSTEIKMEIKQLLSTTIIYSTHCYAALYNATQGTTQRYPLYTPYVLSLDGIDLRYRRFKFLPLEYSLHPPGAVIQMR